MEIIPKSAKSNQSTAFKDDVRGIYHGHDCYNPLKYCSVGHFGLAEQTAGGEISIRLYVCLIWVAFSIIIIGVYYIDPRGIYSI